MEDKKDDFIKIRITKSDKEMLKKYAEEQGQTLTELVMDGIEKKLNKRVYTLVNQEKLETRVTALESKIQELKELMETRKNIKKGWFR